MTRKAVLNALSAFLDYFTQLAVSLFVNPLMVAGLGDYFFGLWQTLNRMIGYLSPASGKPTQTLRWTLANQQSSIDYDLKRSYVGSAILVSMLFLPIMAVGGALLAWYTPSLLKIPVDYIWQVRVTVFLIVGHLIIYNIVALPQSILQGENLGYKRIGLTPVLTILSGIFTWLVLYLKFGIVGLAAVSLSLSILAGFLYVGVVRTNIAWLGIKRPTVQGAFSFFRLSTWFIAWDVVMKLMLFNDVIVLALFKSIESVTSYTITKYAPEAVISFVAIMVFGILPGLGGVIGSGQVKKAARLRDEITIMTWLLLTVFGTTILIWNRVFIYLWVGVKQYAGLFPNLLIILVVAQFVFIKNDASIISLTLNIRQKVIIGALSAGLSIALSSILVGYFHLGYIGLSLGLLIGRSVLSLAYPILIGRFLGISLFAQLIYSIRAALVSIILFGFGLWLSSLQVLNYFTGFGGWMLFMTLASLTALIILFLYLFTGFNSQQRTTILQRLKNLRSHTSD